MDDLNDSDDEYVDDYVPMRKKRLLYLAIDNDPEYHGRLNAEEQKEKKVKRSVSIKKKAGKSKEKEITKKEETSEQDTEDTNADKQEDGQVKKLFLYRYGIIGALTLGVVTGFYLGRYTIGQNIESHSPNQIIPLYRDLDNDGTTDAYVELKNGHKIPMYGLRNGSGNSIKYITSEEINKISLKGRIYYESLENYLNNP